jgi:hypothetical protein
VRERRAKDVVHGESGRAASFARRLLCARRYSAAPVIREEISGREYHSGRLSEITIHERMSESLRSHFFTRRALGAIALSCVLAACGTTSDVTAGAQPNTFTVTGKATGTNMSWVTARNAAMDAASDYCKQRSQRVAIRSEATSGVRSLSEQTSTVSFSCVSVPESTARG